MTTPSKAGRRHPLVAWARSSARRLLRSFGAAMPTGTGDAIVPSPYVPDRTTLQVDVRRLIDSLSDDDLRQCADEYFSGITVDSPQCHKPFMDPDNAVHLCAHLGLLFEAADLFPAAEVLDFGCGTGWLTMALGQIGCRAVGVDLSPKAIELARRLAAEGRPGRRGAAEFASYDGRRLPFEDGRFDRIVCFDAFHHVKDQQATLAEFARVLRPGGRVAFVEPGPHHSTTPQSQAEMLHHRVIENDVVMEDIARFAEAVGLAAPEFLLQYPRPLRVGLEDFRRWSSDGVPAHEARRLIHPLISSMTDGQYFHLQKGEPALDSRRPRELAGALRLLSAAVTSLPSGASALDVRLRVHNVGRAVWRCAEPGAGQVRVGVTMFAQDGHGRPADHARIPLPVPALPPNETAEVLGRVPLPAPNGFRLRFDLVAENVAWFSQLGSDSAVEWAPPQ